MFCIFPNSANMLTVFSLAINIGWGNLLSYWQSQIYGQKGYCLFIGVVFMEGAN